MPPPEVVEVVPAEDVVPPDGVIALLGAGDVAVLVSAAPEEVESPAAPAAPITADAALDAESAAEAAVAPAVAEAAGSTGATATWD
jgi:hypothetical protein